MEVRWKLAISKVYPTQDKLRESHISTRVAYTYAECRCTLLSIRGAFVRKSVKTNQWRASRAYTHSIVALNLPSIHSHVSQDPTHAAIMYEMNAHPQPGATYAPDVEGARHALLNACIVADEVTRSFLIDPLTRVSFKANGRTRRR